VLLRIIGFSLPRNLLIMPKGGTTLLLVDVQKDFHPGGSLAIPNAAEDANRIAALIRSNADSIHRIVATMDSHQKLHIAHPSFWLSSDTPPKHPDPFTIISAEDIRQGIWKPRGDLEIPADMLDPLVFQDAASVQKIYGTLDLEKYCIEYATRLETAGRFQICVWPEHCLIGSAGHGMVDTVFKAMNEWSEQTGRSVEWVMKGQNLLTEMYSALAADVPVTRDTAFNEKLQVSLMESSKLLVCGQAMSHCVNYTLRDIVSRWPSDRLSHIYLLTDCGSAVPGFEAAAEAFQNDMVNAGVQLRKSTDTDLVKALRARVQYRVGKMLVSRN
jgi:nicotinamidase/pyrazinamidase